jgi:hypothetical protein
LVEWKEW